MRMAVSLSTFSKRMFTSSYRSKAFKMFINNFLGGFEFGFIEPVDHEDQALRPLKIVPPKYPLTLSSGQILEILSKSEEIMRKITNKISLCFLSYLMVSILMSLVGLVSGLKLFVLTNSKRAWVIKGSVFEIMSITCFAGILQTDQNNFSLLLSVPSAKAMNLKVIRADQPVMIVSHFRKKLLIKK